MQMKGYPSETAVSPRNLGMDVFKWAASLFVVFLHVSFPEPVGPVVACMARAAVPGFFAISGFFSYGVDSSRLVKRMRSLLWLTVMGFALMICADCIAIECGASVMAEYQNSTMAYLVRQIPDLEELAACILLDQTPINGALWYLVAALKCYGVLWCYVRFFGGKKPNYQMLYLTGVFLFLLYLVLGVLSIAAGKEPEPGLLRNALLLGMPMFVMGLFLGQYWRDIWINFRLTAKTLVVLFVLGMGLSLFEQAAVHTSDAHIGSVVSVLAALLLLARDRLVFRSRIAIAAAERCGSWSVGIYLVHMPVNRIVGLFIPESVAYSFWWFKPILVAGLSLLLAMLNSEVYRWIKGHKTKAASRSACSGGQAAETEGSRPDLPR